LARFSCDDAGLAHTTLMLNLDTNLECKPSAKLS
jgi:hypothetical protein